MLISGVLTAIGFVVIAAKFSKTFLKKILGYDWLVDIIATFGMFAFFSGTITGAMTAIYTGLSISLILCITKNTYGYSKLAKIDGNYKWIDFEGEWTLGYAGKFIGGTVVGSVINGCKDFYNSCINGYTSASIPQAVH
jgi:hypothetical protein